MVEHHVAFPGIISENDVIDPDGTNDSAEGTPVACVEDQVLAAVRTFDEPIPQGPPTQRSRARRFLFGYEGVVESVS